MFSFRNKKSAAPAGEPFVWFSGLGLALAVLMIVGLLGVIAVNGVAVFVPKRVDVVTLREGAELPNVGRVFAAETIATREKHDGSGANERLFFLGNKELYGRAFAYVNEADIAAVERRPGILVAERTEYGNAVFLPKSLRLVDGAALPAEAPEFDATLARLLDENAGRRAAIARLEREELGALNREIAARSRRADYRERTGGESGRREAAALREEVAELRARYAAPAAESSRLRAEQTGATLTYVTLDGREVTRPLGDIIRLTKPNDLHAGERVVTFCQRVWRFVSEAPREANTEGGVFPAIFGTLVMTVCMSALVTPFGVLAAIYLREYAKQGPFVRWVRISVNNLAGVPSIVFGLFGLGFFVYVVGQGVDAWFFAEETSGGSPVFGTGGLLWASFTLALMTLPVVIVATEEALAAVPRGVREASLALGASKWLTISRVVLPSAAPGVLTGVILAMARGAGEVAPLMMVGVVKLAPTLPLDGEFPFLHGERKFMHLGFHIFDIGFQSPDSDAARPMVFATTLLLILLVVVLNLGAIMLRNRLRNKYKAGAF